MGSAGGLMRYLGRNIESSQDPVRSRFGFKQPDFRKLPLLSKHIMSKFSRGPYQVRENLLIGRNIERVNKLLITSRLHADKHEANEKGRSPHFPMTSKSEQSVTD